MLHRGYPQPSNLYLGMMPREADHGLRRPGSCKRR